MCLSARRGILVGLLALACSDDLDPQGSGGDGSTASASTTGSGDDRPSSDVDGESTTRTSGDDHVGDDTSGDDSPFIVTPDGGPGRGCEQPEPLEQPPSCGNGIREPDEFCYQGSASIVAMAEGTTLADFGAGPVVMYTSLEGPAGVLVHPATAEGLLAPPTILDIPGAYDLDAADLDGDDMLDLVVAHGDADSQVVSLLHGLGDGTFAPWTTSEVPSMWHVAVANLDGDAHLDLVGTTDRYYALGDLHLAMDESGDGWIDDDVLDLGGDVWFEAGDLDGDGLDDLVLLVIHADAVREILVVPMTPSGPADGWVLDTHEQLGRGILGFFDEDAVLDIAYWRDGDLVTRFGLGDGTFSTPLVEPANNLGLLRSADLDGDGRSELVGASAVRATTTGDSWEFDLGCGHYGAKLVSTWDIDDDGLRDIVISTGYGQEAGALHLVQSNP